MLNYIPLFSFSDENGIWTSIFHFNVRQSYCARSWYRLDVCLSVCLSVRLSHAGIVTDKSTPIKTFIYLFSGDKYSIMKHSNIHVYDIWAFCLNIIATGLMNCPVICQNTLIAILLLFILLLLIFLLLFSFYKCQITCHDLIVCHTHPSAADGSQSGKYYCVLTRK